MVRLFEVADEELFIKVQRQAMETVAGMGSPYPRSNVASGITALSLSSSRKTPVRARPA
jgi:hypothetical protein